MANVVGMERPAWVPCLEVVVHQMASVGIRRSFVVPAASLASETAQELAIFPPTELALRMVKHAKDRLKGTAAVQAGFVEAQPNFAELVARQDSELALDQLISPLMEHVERPERLVRARILEIVAVRAASVERRATSAKLVVSLGSEPVQEQAIFRPMVLAERMARHVLAQRLEPAAHPVASAAVRLLIAVQDANLPMEHVQQSIIYRLMEPVVRTGRRVKALRSGIVALVLGSVAKQTLSADRDAR